VVVLRVGRSGCSLKVVMVVGYRWGSESEAFAFQSRTSAATHICSCTCYIGSCVENSAIDVGLFSAAQRNTIWAAYSLISVTHAFATISSRIRDLMVQIEQRDHSIAINGWHHMKRSRQKS